MVVKFSAAAKFVAVIAGTAAAVLVADKVIDKVIDKVHSNSDTEPAEANDTKKVAKSNAHAIIVAAGVGIVAFMLYMMGWEHGIVDGLACAAQEQMTTDDVGAVIGDDEAFRHTKEVIWKAVHK